MCRGYWADQFPQAKLLIDLETKPKGHFAFLKSSNFEIMLSEELSYNSTSISLKFSLCWSYPLICNPLPISRDWGEKKNNNPSSISRDFSNPPVFQKEAEKRLVGNTPVIMSGSQVSFCRIIQHAAKEGYSKRSTQQHKIKKSAAWNM